MKILLAATIWLFAAAQPVWNTNFEQAKAEAQKNNKNILLRFSGSDWCIPCIKMEKTIFATTSFASYADKNLVLVQADFPRLKKHQLSKEQTGRNEQLAAKYNPQGKFPLTVLLSADGKVLQTWDGLPDGNADAFVRSIKPTVRVAN